MHIQNLVRTVAMATALGLVVAGAAEAKTYYLKAQRFVLPVPDVDASGATSTRMVPMWGYAECSGPDVGCGMPTVPGPALTVQENQNLIVYVQNDLTWGTSSDPVTLDAGKTSFSISGLRLRENNGPVFWGPSDFDPAGDAAQPARVRSMTHEAANGGSWVRYRWLANQGDLKPGTYVYQSATHPAIQVQMGLYGPLTVTSATAGQTYPGVAADASADIFYSEIDASLHNDVDAGLSGYDPKPPAGNPLGARTSPIDYSPTFYLVNGKPVKPGPFEPTFEDPASGGVVGGYFDQTTMVRFRSAALRTHIPMSASGATFDVVAETAEPYDVPRKMNSVLLPAMTTADAIVRNAKEGAAMIMDRALGATGAGGMSTFLVLPDQLTVLAPNCTGAGRFQARVRTNSSLAENQKVAVQIKNNTSGDMIEYSDIPYQAEVAGLPQFRQLLDLTESAKFCSGEITIKAISGSGGSAEITRVLP